jgi:flagella basal body P-ring formation protein FlgA
MIIARHLPAAMAFLATLAMAGAGNAAPPEYLPVANATIYPGDAISEAMLTDAAFPAGTSANFPVVTTHGEVAGKVARRTLLPGHLILRNAIAEPAVVEKGSIVPAIYQDGELTITASVLALQSGALSQAIQVRNVDSGKVIVGAVQADGSVRIASQ